MQVEWCTSDGIGRPTVQRESLQAVLATATNRAIVVLVPAEDVVLTEVDLPIRQRAKLLQAIPYSLEEQFAEDVDKLHFAAGERQANGRIPVLVASHARMKNWLAPFEAAGVRPKAIVPDVLCLPGPVDDEHWSALCEGNKSVVRTGPYQGFACETEALPDYLALAQAGEELHLQVAIAGESEHEALQSLPVRHIERDNSCQLGLESLRLLRPESAINLLQGSYAEQTGYVQIWRPLRFTAVLFLAWIFLATLAHGIDYFRLKSEVARFETQNKELIAQLFPEIKTLVPGSERVQLERRLSELRGSGGQAGLFHALSSLAEGLQAVGKLDLQELQLRDKTLYISMIARDISTLELFKSHYSKQSLWSLEVESANASSDGVQIRARLLPVTGRSS